LTERFPLPAEFFISSENQEEQMKFYENSRAVYSGFGCKNKLDYAKLYTKWAVVQLAQVLKNSVTWCVKYLQLSPFSTTISSFGFDAVFAHSGAQF
jgi:hypothetical protein